MYRVYGFHPSRTTRVLWALEEVGASYEISRVPPGSQEARAFNPSGKVPVLEVLEDGFRLIDSSAICCFLADRHPEAKLTFPAGTHERGEMDSWLHFAMSDLEVPVWNQSRHTFIYSDELKVPDILKVCAMEWDWAVEAMDARLGEGPYLMGGRFTIPDIVMGHICKWATTIGLEVKRPRVVAYFERIQARPALARAYARGKAEASR